MMSTEVQKKKALYVVTKSVWGGAQKYVFDLASNLPKDLFEPTVCAGGSGFLFHKLLEKNIRTISVNGLERDLGFLKEIGVFFRLFRVFFRERPDIIHLNSSKIGGIGGAAALLYKLITFNFNPVTIFTVHGWPFREDRPPLARAGIFLASFASALLCDKIILINTADFQTAQKFLPKRKCVLIFNGIAPPEFASRRDARAHFARHLRRPLTEDTFLIGTIAEYTRNKGLSSLIEAAHHIRTHAPQFTFHILLMGEGEDREMLANRIRAFGLDSHVFLTGHLDEDISKTYRYLKGLDAFALPSVKEGLPYAALEAMAGALPIVATEVGGIPDLFDHEKEGLLVPKKEPLALAGALCDFFLSKEKRERMGRAAQKKQSEKFSLAAMVKNTIAVYDQTHE